MSYNAQTFALAVDIIDNLRENLQKIQCIDNSTIISDEALKKINEQYEQFINIRQNIILQVNENSKNIINSLKSLELPDLNTLLCSKFASTKHLNNLNFKCSKCNASYKCKKSLTNHERSCKHVDTEIKSNTDEDNSASPVNTTEESIINDSDKIKPKSKKVRK